MRLSSSSASAAGSNSMMKRNPVASTVVFGCVCLLLPLVTGSKSTEIDLKSANHDQDLAHGTAPDAKHSSLAIFPRLHDSGHIRRSKPNKSSFKKYIDDSSGDQQRKEKKSIYDKKYFDYMPAELKDPLDAATHESLAKRTNSRRFRRDTDGAELRTKRNGYWQSGYSYQVPMIIPGSVFLQYDPNNNYRPQLNNNYLPPAVLSPVPPQPDRSYLPAAIPRPQSTEPPGMFVPGNRFGNSNRDVFLFDMVYDPSVGTDYRLTPGPRPSTGTNDALFPSNVLGRPQFTTTVRPLSAGAPTSTSSTVTTTTPRPEIQHNSDDDFDWSSLGLSPDAAVGSRLGGNGNSINDNTLNTKRKEPSKCTWAIANCCSQFSDRIRYYCFEQNQCYGAFWGDNVCRGYYRLALAEIENYYNV